jgi:phosphatidylglycerophosphatase A
MKVQKLIAGCLGIGHIKGGGTIAAAICCVPWYMSQRTASFEWLALAITVIVTALGIWAANVVEKDWGKDSGRVVIDEAAGMMISLLFVPVTIPYMITGFVLFRLLDITKPLLIRKTELLPGGWGVMMDDILAGVYTNLLLHTIMWLNVF